MFVVDIIVGVILLGALWIGAVRGLLASVGTLLGFAVGGFLALWIMPLLTDALPAETWRSIVVLIVGAALLGLGAGLGGALGARIGQGTARVGLRVVDRTLGGALSLVVAALAVSLVGQSVAATGTPGISSAVSSSVVLRTIDQLTPRAVTSTLAQLRGAVMDEGLPRIAQLFSPVTTAPAPAIDLGDPQLERAALSVARISGVAYSCGSSSTGSGFVLTDDRVVTNAHVVAGVTTPVVEFPGGEVREGRVVYFDPNNDLAVVAVDGLDAAVLPVVPTLSAGSAAVVQGYPYGGPFTSTSAQVTAVGPATIADIYGRSTVVRDVYALAATVRPGNSGGPLLTSSGEVAGIVFARDETNDQVGYAMTMTELTPVLAQAPDLSATVSTGPCA